MVAQPVATFGMGGVDGVQHRLALAGWYRRATLEALSHPDQGLPAAQVGSSCVNGVPEESLQGDALCGSRRPDQLEVVRVDVPDQHVGHAS
ncbi:hypothetical protein DQ238_18115 [Geodermatophilus sp. TF02-6]|nr:hypothetical protein DQ238_18115 [Geodermatophilus sp. TF02-6]